MPPANEHLANRVYPLQAPREDRGALVEPPFERLGLLVEENLRIRQQYQGDLQGRSLREVSQMARAELLAAARQWTAAYRNVPSAPFDPRGVIFLAGHQPQMFHPGVWIKNFALGELSRRHSATAVNLVVDSDVFADASLLVPGGTVSEPGEERIPYDQPEPKIPCEERRIEDRGMFAAFGRRVIEQISPLVADPSIERYWRMVCSRGEHSDRLGACLAQARHQLEQFWGLETWEVPQSCVCGSEAFQWFMVHLLARLPEFHAIHNEALREYRQAHCIRSISHPAPELATEGDWLEAPFWVWTAADPRRRRLFARRSGDEIALNDRGSWEVRLPLRADGRGDRAVEQLLEIQRGGVRIRSRALITTLWARLALGDLFIHGIGGAKYDRVTDAIIGRFFGLRPPGFMVLSATLLLPIERERATADQLPAIRRQLRDLAYHPEQCLEGVQNAPAELIDAKRRWIETRQTVENARRRCRAIREINAGLQPWLNDRRERLLELQAQALGKLRAESILARREYAFCLYPEETMRSFFGGLLHKPT